MRALFGLLILLSAFASATVFADQKIIDPNPMPAESFRAVGKLESLVTGEYCVGVLIDRSKVLTSATCLSKLGADDLEFWGNDDSGPLSRPVGKVRIHPGYNPAHPQGSIDAAVAVLKTEFYAGWYPSPYNSLLTLGKQGLAVSFQKDADDNESARIMFESYWYLRNGQERVLAGLAFRPRCNRPTQMVCPEDVGSPLYVDGKLVGVLSHVVLSPNGVGCSGVVSAHYVSYKYVKLWIDSTVP